MENTILKRTKILYDDDHFVNVTLVYSEDNDEKGYVTVVQIDDLAVYCSLGAETMSDADDLYYDELINIFSMTFDELMEDFHDHEVVEELYEETRYMLGLSEEAFEHKKPSELFNAMQDVSRVEMVMKHSTFSKLING